MESENSQPNANQLFNFNSNYEIFSRERIEETPFTLVTDNEKQLYFGALGNHRLTEQSEDKEKIIKETTEITWDRIIQVITIITPAIGEAVEMMMKNKETKQQQQ